MNGVNGGSAAGGRPRRPWNLRTRLLPIAGLLAGALVVAILLVSISVGEQEPREVRIGEAEQVQRLIGGIRQLGDRLGHEDAPLRITLFTDVTCRPCATYQREVVEPLIAERVRPGEAQLTLRHFPLGRLPVTLGAIGSMAAGEQGRQWQYATLLLRNLDQAPQGAVDERFLGEVAAALPRFDTGRWESAFADPALADAVEADTELATELRLPADPAVIVDGANGSERLLEAPSLAEIEAAIARVG